MSNPEAVHKGTWEVKLLRAINSNNGALAREAIQMPGYYSANVKFDGFANGEEYMSFGNFQDYDEWWCHYDGKNALEIAMARGADEVVSAFKSAGNARRPSRGKRQRVLPEIAPAFIADEGLSKLSYMKLKKHLIALGIPKAEVDACPSKQKLLYLHSKFLENMQASLDEDIRAVEAAMKA